MKKVLGLDLGVASIGWAVVNVDQNDDPYQILGMGSRIVPLTTDDANEFNKGQAISKNQKRTMKRTIRKGYDRFQLRRENLTAELRKLKMLPDEKLIKLPILDLWELRAKAATSGCKLELPEIGRILYHINQKRGYKHAKADENDSKNQKDYVEIVNSRFAMIHKCKQTIGQYFAEQIKKSKIEKNGKVFYTYRTKEQVFPRKAYEEEFDQIIEVQKEFYPKILTEKEIYRLRNEIIFYQRKLKSCKHLVSICDFEKKSYVNKEGQNIFNGPRVAPKSSPLAQLCRIWEFVNNLRFEYIDGKKQELELNQKHQVAEFLDNHEKMTASDFQKMFKLKKGDFNLENYFGKNGISGNITKCRLAKELAGTANINNLLKFEIKIEDTNCVNKYTGEVLQCVTDDFKNEPLYMLWHTIYSISDKEELVNCLSKNFSIDRNNAEKLFKIDFVKLGYSNKSAKAMRKILPYLMQGIDYSNVCTMVGYNPSNSLSSAENEARILLNRLPLIKKNELKQPVVEKIMNQMVNIVNAIFEEYKTIDEIHVELARSLKQTKDERHVTMDNIAKNEKSNKQYAEKIEELNIVASKSKIQKYRLWEESGHKCFYCDQPVNVTEFLNALDVEVEHIIPKSLLFDDSFSNKVCACKNCNKTKNNQTAFDFMKSKSETLFEAYCSRVDYAYKNHRINKSKHDHLLWTREEIPNDFIDRQLRLSQYISKKSMDILKQVCRKVYATSGSVTDFIRHTWGYDEVLHQLNFERYKQSELTELKEYIHHGQKHREERIKDWTKRLDHRHHAIDALVIAMTKQSIVQQLNHLNTERDAMFNDIKKQSIEWKKDYSLLQEWLKEKKHFKSEEVAKKVSEILISFKTGKRVVTMGKRIKYKDGKKIILQKDIMIPRGALNEETVYGKIKKIDPNKSLKDLFNNPSSIIKTEIRILIQDRLALYNGDVKKALESLKMSPIIFANNKILEKADCFKEEYVVRYPLSTFKAKDIQYIVDEHIKQIMKERLDKFSGKENEAFRDLENNPIYADVNCSIPIRTVRCYTGLNAVVPVKRNENCEAIGFVKPGNNHHIALYKDADGNLREMIVSFWHAVERKLKKIPVIIKNPTEVHELIKDDTLSTEFKELLPKPNWTFVESLQENEMFVLGLDDKSYSKAIAQNDLEVLNRHLYRVQSLSASDYWFRLHIETINDKTTKAGEMKKFYRIRSLNALMSLNPNKVKISLLGKLIL